MVLAAKTPSTQKYTLSSEVEVKEGYSFLRLLRLFQSGVGQVDTLQVCTPLLVDCCVGSHW